MFCWSPEVELITILSKGLCPKRPQWLKAQCLAWARSINSDETARFLCATIWIFKHDQIGWRTCATYCPFWHINLDSSFFTDWSNKFLLILLFVFVSLCFVFFNFSLIFRLTTDLQKFGDCLDFFCLEFFFEKLSKFLQNFQIDSWLADTYSQRRVSVHRISKFINFSFVYAYPANYSAFDFVSLTLFLIIVFSDMIQSKLVSRSRLWRAPGSCWVSTMITIYRSRHCYFATSKFNSWYFFHDKPTEN